MKDDKILRLRPPSTKRGADTDKTLQIVRDFSCRHRWFVVDETKNEVECGECGERLNPIWVLEQFAIKETALACTRDRLARKVDELKGRTRYKCGSCGQMNNLTETLRFRT